MHTPHNSRFALLAGVLAMAVAGAGHPAAAAECTGNDVTELQAGCSVLTTNADFDIQLYAPPGADVLTAGGIRNALNTALIFVHGYSVTDTTLPALLAEDGTDAVLAQLQAYGISVVAMAPGNARTDRVEDDARAMQTALLLLNAYRDPAAFPWVVLGHSMGGLAARIALATMEADATAHHVGLYVSYDAPHSGVNVPQGMQNLKVKLDEWAAMTEADFIAIDPGWEGVFNLASIVGITTTLDPEKISGVPDPTTTQAQQMTIQGVVAPAEYPAFMQLLSQTGFPAVRKIAVTNGNTQGIGSTQTVAAGEELFYFTGAKGNSAASVRGTFQIFTDQPGATCFLSNVYYDGLIRNHDGGNRNASTPADITLMDHFSGGSLDYAAKMLAAAAAASNSFHEPSYRGASGSAIPFVTTSSALALPVGTADSQIAALVTAGQTPFDRVFATGDLPAFSANVDHNTIVIPNALLDEITSVLFCQQLPVNQQNDVDGDGVGDACDDDDDNDGVADLVDNCPSDDNALQADLDMDGEGDACDGDDDGDGVADATDNCPLLANPDQMDADSDGLGDGCDDSPQPVANPADSTPGCTDSAMPQRRLPLAAGLAPFMLCLLLRSPRRRRPGRAC